MGKFSLRVQNDSMTSGIDWSTNAGTMFGSLTKDQLIRDMAERSLDGMTEQQCQDRYGMSREQKLKEIRGEKKSQTAKPEPAPEPEPEAKLEVPDARPELSHILRRIRAGRKNIWLSGPAGSGKTTLARTVSETLGLRFGFQSFAPDITSSALVGGINVQGQFTEAAFVDFYENGGVYLLDEIDAADPSILLIMNAALDNGILSIPRHHDQARRMIKRHQDTIVICAANTWGTGADAQYIGRNQLDAAFLSRFALSQFFIDYDQALERKLCGDGAVLTQFWRIRQKLKDHKIRRLCGTREIVAAGQLRAAGFRSAEIVEALTVSWTAEEKAKALA